MECYKEINKALIINNQELRIQNGALQKEIISLRHQLMDEHSRRVIGEKTFISILIANFRTAVAKISPENDLLELLRTRDDDYEGSSAAVGNVRGRRLSKPRSSEILKELRRSNFLQRRSSIVGSPTRRSSSTMSMENEVNETPNIRSTIESLCSLDNVERSSCDSSLEESTVSVSNSDVGNSTQGEESDSDTTDDHSGEIQQEDEEVVNEPTPKNMQNLSYITEEEHLQENGPSFEDADDLSDEDEDMPEEDEDLPEEGEDLPEEDEDLPDEYEENNMMVDEVTELQNNEKPKKGDEPQKGTYTSKQVSELKKTVEQSPTLVQRVKANRRKASTNYRSALKDVSNLFNDYDEQNSEMGSKSHTKPENPHIVVRRGKRRSIVSDDSIQTARNVASRRTQKQDGTDDEPFLIANNTTKDRDPSIENGLISIGYNELTIGQFAEALSSTPNNNNNSNTNNAKEEDTIYNEQSSRKCAKRSCRPKCLAEPSLIRKLRNDGPDKSRNTSRKKK